jgi:hypothetical protein
MTPEIWPALGLAGSFAVAVWLRERRVQTRLRMRDESLESCRYSVATIAKNLAPKLKRLTTEDRDFSSPTLYIVGGDGYPLWTEDDYPWRGGLKDVLKNGGVIHYLLTNPSSIVMAKLSRVKSELESGTEGKVHFYFVSSELVDETDQAVIESLRTFHPMLIEGESKRAMWVEGYHPANSTVAYSCKFTSPDEAKTDPDYDRYKEVILRLIEKCRNAKTKAAAA